MLLNMLYLFYLFVFLQMQIDGPLNLQQGVLEWWHYHVPDD